MQIGPRCGAAPVGSSFRSHQIVGIGRADAQQIWFRGITVYMTANTNYAGARAATLSAATDLFGASSTQYAAVAAAWSAVNVN